MSNLLCDCCGKPIKTPKDGWVEWRERFISKENIHFSYLPRIIHKKCIQSSRHPETNDLELQNHVTSEGIERLREHFRQTKLPDDEALEIIKRIQQSFG